MVVFGVFFTGMVVLSGCSTSPPLRDTELVKKKTELPLDLKKTFEVQEEKEAHVAVRIQKKTKKVNKKEKKKVFEYPVRRPSWNPIYFDEKMTYEVTYFGATAAYFFLDVLPFKTINSRRVYHFRGKAKSSSVFKLFYEMDDQVESFVDFEGVFSHRFNLTLNESKQVRNSIELFNSKKEETYYWDYTHAKGKQPKETKKSEKIKPFSQDLFSAIHYLRFVEFPDGGVIRFPLVTEAKNWEVEIVVQKRTTMKTPLGRRTKVVRVEVRTIKDGKIKQQGKSFIWYTDDERRIPVLIEAKVKVGTVKAALTEVQLGHQPAL